MLVLTRKVGESLLIGDNIEITLVRIEGDQVRIGVSAPRSVAVYRKELLDEVRQENLRAAQAARQAEPPALEELAPNKQSGAGSGKKLPTVASEKDNIAKKDADKE
jgi:carbon storage regulator